jgi:hypothetical protein
MFCVPSKPWEATGWATRTLSHPWLDVTKGVLVVARDNREEQRSSAEVKTVLAMGEGESSVVGSPDASWSLPLRLQRTGVERRYRQWRKRERRHHCNAGQITANWMTLTTAAAKNCPRCASLCQRFWSPAHGQIAVEFSRARFS